MSSPGFWDDQERAQAVINELKGMKGILDPYRSMTSDMESCQDMLGEMADMPGDERDELMPDVVAEVTQLQQQFESLEVQQALGGRTIPATFICRCKRARVARTPMTGPR